MMLNRMTNEFRFAAALGLIAFAFSGCGPPANDSATGKPVGAKVTFHVNGMGERLHLF